MHPVLLFLGLQQIVGVDVFEPDKDPLAAGARRLLDEVRDAVAERVDLDDELQPEPLALAHLDQTVEDRLPIPVAREIVVGDEKTEDALGEIGAHQPLDIVGVAPARLAPLHIDDRAKAALERAAAPGVEGADRLAVAPHDVERQKRRHLLLQPGQIVHVVVDRLEPAGERIGEDLDEPPFGLAGEEADPEPAGRLEVGRQLRQHRHATRHVKPADRDLDAGFAKPGGQVHRARELVRLHADEADEPGIGALDPPDDAPHRDDGVALVIGADLDRDVGAERAPLGQIRRDPVKTGERIRRDPRFPPLDHIAVVVVMRRLD